MGSLDASATLRWNGYLGQIEGDSGSLSVATATQSELG
jgi:predicted ATP-dependent protease